MLESHALDRELRLIGTGIDQVVGKVTNDLQLDILESLLAYVFAILMKILVDSESLKTGEVAELVSVSQCKGFWFVLWKTFLVYISLLANQQHTASWRQELNWRER
jgi:hypothetical protein